MKKVLISCAIVFGSIFFVNAEGGSGGDCPCWQEMVCRDANLNPIGTISCTGPEGTCISGEGWIECGGVRSYCVEPV